MRQLLLLLIVLLAAGPAWSAPVDDAAAANDRGDYAAQLRIIRPLAVKGEAWAQLQLGDSYRIGKGVPKNDFEAVNWYRLAAAQGDASAQHKIGLMYFRGQGVVLDYAESAKFYRLAAAQGHLLGQLELGLLYLNGQGVVQDSVRAHMWLNLAAIAGNKGAEFLRESAATKLTPQQIAEAQKLGRECQARSFKGCD